MPINKRKRVHVLILDFVNERSEVSKSQPCGRSEATHSTEYRLRRAAVDTVQWREDVYIRYIIYYIGYYYI